MDGAEGGGATLFIDVDVSLITNDVLITTGLTVSEDGDEVAHSAGGDEEGGFFTGEGGGVGLKGVDGRVVTVHVVTNG
jgi:hypothetical protein